MSRVRRGLMAVCAVAMSHTAVQLALWAPAVPAAPMMPAAGGPLTELAIQFHRPGADVFLPVFGALLTELDPSTQVRVVVADTDDQAMFEASWNRWFPGADGPEIHFAFTDRPITSWMRDRLAVLPAHSDRPAVLLAPRAPMTGTGERVHDWTVPWTLADHLGSRAIARETPYQFEGGDLIADDHYVYVASPLLTRNPEWSKADLLGALEADLGLPILPIGFDDLPVPEHHIGMFVTPIGGGRVLVADPRLGSELLVSSGLAGNGWLEVGGQPLAVDDSSELFERFDNVADTLIAHGIDVVRMPLVPSQSPWVWMSYNNVMLERREDGRLHVYLPTYGVSELDDAAASIWHHEGAQVHPIDVSRLFRFGGSVRCLVAPLGRGPAVAVIAGL